MSGWRLRALLREALGASLAGGDDPPVLDVTQSVADVGPGSLFIARRGAKFDGHEFAAEARARGAVAMVGERSEAPIAGLPYLQVADARAATSPLAATFFHHPSRTLRVAGVTGTDGKTTTAALLHHILQGTTGAVRSGLLSTARTRIGHQEQPSSAGFTTPEAPEVQRFLARVREAGGTFAVLEASSHASALGRLNDVRFASMAWTNLTPEHLDLHGTFEAYREAKLALVRGAARAVLHRADPSYPFFAEAAAAHSAPPLDYGRSPGGALHVEQLSTTPSGFRFEVCAAATPDEAAQRASVELPMLGGVNVENALAAIGSARVLGVPLAEAAAALFSFPGVPGRMELIASAPLRVVVDFAHTPPALELALKALRPASGRLWLLIGAPGERDPVKRPELGAVAVRWADGAVFTEDDSRSEDRDRILAEIEAGARAAGGVEGVDFRVIGDRREAIRAILAGAAPGDTVLLAGKGHETTLKRSAETLPWNEGDEARAALAELGIA